MPVTLIKRPDGKVTVKTPHGIKAKATTVKKAMAQRRLLQGVEHGWRPSK